jgi:hypothetical protein
MRKKAFQGSNSLSKWPKVAGAVIEAKVDAQKLRWKGPRSRTAVTTAWPLPFAVILPHTLLVLLVYIPLLLQTHEVECLYMSNFLGSNSPMLSRNAVPSDLLIFD